MWSCGSQDLALSSLTCVTALTTVQRLTHHRRLSYNTASNKTRLSRTPGDRVVHLYTKEVGEAPGSACGVCPGQLRGVRAVRPKVLVRSSETRRHGSRACGGPRCATGVCDRVERVFLIEGQKIIGKVLKAQAQSQKAKKKPKKPEAPLNLEVKKHQPENINAADNKNPNRSPLSQLKDQESSSLARQKGLRQQPLHSRQTPQPIETHLEKPSATPSSTPMRLQ
ncbi:60S ribosomal protein L34-like [Molossus molossus]|uniref:60S ribosomal protein L34-like n=1 Tax=Molossus molossus TaxID=27622 RepID=UPI0017478A46|nr:60S ribosomal protein L34-like [Molossus molossus]